MEQVIDVIFNNGVGIGCLLYFMWFNQSVMKTMNDTLSKISERLSIIENNIGLDKRKGE